MPEPLSDKHSLRSDCLKARQAIPDSARHTASEAIIPHLLELLPAQAVIAGYAAIRGELDVFPLLTILAQKKYALCLPVTVAGNVLVFQSWQPGLALITGNYDVRIPEPNQPKVTPDVILVPMVAFDGSGHRLGYGAGYYDRAIANLRQKNKHLRVIGIAYSVQQVASIPAGPHDEIMDAVVTEMGIIRPK